MSKTVNEPWVFGAKNERHRGTVIEAQEGKVYTTEQAITVGGLDWLVELRDPITNDDDAVPAKEWKQVVKVESVEIEVEGVKTLSKAFRTLGIVKLRYKELQNRAAFRFFDRALIDGAATLVAVGHLDFGKRVWAVAKRPVSMELAPGDEVHEHLILTTSHDGSSAVRVMFAPYRTSTGTMLHVGQGRRMKSEVKVRHTKSIDAKMQTVHNVLQAESDYFDRWRTALIGDPGTGAKGFKQRIVTTSEIDKVVKSLFPARIKKDAEGKPFEEISGKAQKARDLVLARIAEQEKTRKEAHEKAGQETPKDTLALDLFLGVSEYAAKDRKAKNEGNNWVVSTFGSGSDLRQESFDLISGL
jgi:hypothetical protein